MKRKARYFEEFGENQGRTIYQISQLQRFTCCLHKHRKVKVVKKNESYEKILRENPEMVSKEKMVKICHISKRNASYFLDHEITPCRRTGKATYKYVIATKDIVRFFQQRDARPELFHIFKTGNIYRQCNASTDIDERQAKGICSFLLSQYEEFLSVADVCSITGYSDETVKQWCSKKWLHHFVIRRAYLIPKESMINFLISQKFHSIARKTDKHLWLLERMQKPDTLLAIDE